MMPQALLLLLAALAQDPAAPADAAAWAAELYEQGSLLESAGAWADLLERLPASGPIAYNLAAALFGSDSLEAAAAILDGDLTSVDPDTLEAARRVTETAAAMATEDFGGVESAVEALRQALSDGLSMDCERQALEAGINWLALHEPPPPEDQQNPEDSGEQEDQEEQEGGEDSSGDQEEQPGDEGEEPGDPGDQESGDEEEPGTPPPVGEMTPEQAQAILDLVEDVQPGDSAGVKAGAPLGGPVW